MNYNNILSCNIYAVAVFKDRIPLFPKLEKNFQQKSPVTNLVTAVYYLLTISQ